MRHSARGAQLQKITTLLFGGGRGWHWERGPPARAHPTLRGGPSSPARAPRPELTQRGAMRTARSKYCARVYLVMAGKTRARPARGAGSWACRCWRLGASAKKSGTAPGRGRRAPAAWDVVSNPISRGAPAALLPLNMPAHRTARAETAAAPAPHVCGLARQAPKQQDTDPDPWGFGYPHPGIPL